MILGKSADGHAVKIDLPRLIESRLILQANSGGGKSWAIRRILEQTFGHAQQIVVDVEDEFHTLREKFDYILAGHGGDCPADPRSAALLARRLLELNASAIVGIYELRAHDRIRFVRLFLDSLVNAPRELWHPVLVVVDEAHIFAPQQGQAESTGAVIDLMTRGRKRGFCGILATQRISKLHKDAAAEANNKLIGRSALDVDMKRAADELGFSGREDQARLRTLKPGEFFCFGPALTESVNLVNVGDIQTSHPRAGQRAAAAPPPREKIRKILGQLADLPKEAEQEARTVAELQAEIRKLKAENRSAPAHSVPTEELERARADAQAIRAANKLLDHEMNDARRRLKRIAELAALPALHTIKMPDIGPERIVELRRKLAKTTGQAVVLDGPVIEGDNDRPLSKCARAILRVLAADTTKARSASQVAILSEYSVTSSGFANALSELRTRGLVDGVKEALLITHSGMAQAGPVDPLPTGADLLNHWMNKLGKAESIILEVVAREYPSSISKLGIAEQSGYSPTSSGFANALSKLRTLRLIEGREDIKVTPDLGSALTGSMI